MNRKLLIVFVLFQCSLGLFAQTTKNSDKGEEYRRSSLYTILIDEKEMPKRDTIKTAFLSSPIPMKYNNHNLNDRIIAINLSDITDEQREAFNAHVAEFAKDNAPRKKKGGFGAALKGIGNSLLNEMAGGQSVLVDTKSKEDFEVGAYYYLAEGGVAKQLFDKWFIDENGKFSDALMRERGLFDATAIDLQSAGKILGGMDLLATSGEELIGNTFVVISRFRYMSKDEIIAEGQNYMAVAGAATKNAKLAETVGALGGLGAKAIIGDGYYVCITSYLYQLIWDEEVKGMIYEAWDNRDAYDKLDLFKLRFVGSEKARAQVRTGMFANKSEAELISIATINATDAVLAKLEKKYEVFRTKTPMVINEQGEITAHIGTKEDLKGGDKFEVLERVVDNKTGKIEYKKKGEIEVVKDKIWDNIYMASETSDGITDTKGLTATVFKGNAKNFYTGLLIRQLN